ncbi:MAG: AAA family ATPase [Dyadobacter sp.]|uniref:AAA family ATPase n=1 Tax=Dyadobacter sp. TaxID=1914288 RepID=UPI003266FB42
MEKTTETLQKFELYLSDLKNFACMVRKIKGVRRLYTPFHIFAKNLAIKTMKIHIMGASCAGSTTLGMALAKQSGIPYFDTDDYFWEPAETPYTVKRNAELRNQMLLDDLARQNDWILGGSLISWGKHWAAMFDLVVFLYIPKEIRLQRLVEREEERYGDMIYTDAERRQLFQEFLDWASKYDDVDFTGRNIRIHENWLTQITCKVLEIRGDTTVDERLRLIREAQLQ